MSDDEVYFHIIKQGLQFGWIPNPIIGDNFTWKYENGVFSIRTPVWNVKMGKMLDEVSSCSVESVLFNHEFARAIWDKENWKNNLQELAVSTNRAEFLKKYIKV